jgi:uncharacterized protein YjiS (DUF1127 family)
MAAETDDPFLASLVHRLQHLDPKPRRYAALLRLLYPEINRALELGVTRLEIHRAIQAEGVAGSYSALVQNLRRMEARPPRHMPIWERPASASEAVRPEQSERESVDSVQAAILRRRRAAEKVQARKQQTVDQETRRAGEKVFHFDVEDGLNGERKKD